MSCEYLHIFGVVYAGKSVIAHVLMPTDLTLAANIYAMNAALKAG